MSGSFFKRSIYEMECYLLLFNSCESDTDKAREIPDSSHKSDADKARGIQESGKQSRDEDDDICRNKLRETHSTTYNVGILLAEKMTLDSIPTAERYAILTQHIKVDDVKSFPKVFMNGCNRQFTPEWTKSHPWLVYSPHHDCGYCFPCVLFDSKENLGILVHKPFKGGQKCHKS